MPRLFFAAKPLETIHTSLERQVPSPIASLGSRSAISPISPPPRSALVSLLQLVLIRVKDCKTSTRYAREMHDSSNVAHDGTRRHVAQPSQPKITTQSRPFPIIPLICFPSNPMPIRRRQASPSHSQTLTGASSGQMLFMSLSHSPQSGTESVFVPVYRQLQAEFQSVVPASRT